MQWYDESHCREDMEDQCPPCRCHHCLCLLLSHQYHLLLLTPHQLVASSVSPEKWMWLVLLQGSLPGSKCRAGRGLGPSPSSLCCCLSENTPGASHNCKGLPAVTTQSTSVLSNGRWAPTRSKLQDTIGRPCHLGYLGPQPSSSPYLMLVPLGPDASVSTQHEGGCDLASTGP